MRERTDHEKYVQLQKMIDSGKNLFLEIFFSILKSIQVVISEEKSIHFFLVDLINVDLFSSSDWH